MNSINKHCASSFFFTPTYSSVQTLCNLPASNAVFRGSTHIKKRACSLVPAFPRNPTFVISPTVARLLHWPIWDTPCPYCFTCQVFYFLMVYQTRKLNMLKINFLVFHFPAGYFPNSWIRRAQEVGMSKSFGQVWNLLRWTLTPKKFTETLPKWENSSSQILKS